MLKRLLIVAVLAIALASSYNSVAFADADDAASCIGLDASVNAPVNDQIHEFQQIFSPFGGFVSTVAQLHEGTDEECLAAVLGGGD